MTSGRRMIVNSVRIVVDLITCFGDSYVLSAAYGYCSMIFLNK